MILDFNPTKSIEPNSELVLKDYENPNSFHTVMKVPLTIMQIFGFFPLDGIYGQTNKSLKFRWVSIRMVYCLLCLVGHVFNFICYCVNKEIKNLQETNSVIFGLEGIILLIFFIYVAKHWPDFVKKWNQVELAMKTYETPSYSLRKRVNTFIFVMLSLALVENTSLTAYGVVNSLNAFPNDTKKAWENFFSKVGFPEVFSSFPYFPLFGVILQFLLYQKTFIWTFVDIFVVILTMCLKFRLHQIRMRIAKLSRLEVKQALVWRTLRLDYIKLYDLYIQLNEKISWLIIISYVANLYFILTQLCGFLKPKEDLFQKIYYYISFNLLISRVTLVCIFGGSIYEETKEIILVTSSVPSTIYNFEIERLTTHLTTCEVVLTGKNFFRVTRNLILKIASAIVTYELVLMQFGVVFDSNDTK